MNSDVNITSPGKGCTWSVHLYFLYD